MARQCFVSPMKAQGYKPRASYSSKCHDNHAEKQHKASQHRCAKVKACQVATVDALLRAWLCGPVSMCMVHIAVCYSMVEGDRRQQAIEARRQQLLQAHLSSNKQYLYKPRAQVQVVALPETAPVPQQPLLQPADNTTNMQLSYKLPSYNTYLANLLASFKLQEFKADMMMRKSFRATALITLKLTPTYKAQLLQRLPTFAMQLAKTIPSYTNSIVRTPLFVPTFTMFPFHKMNTAYQMFPFYKMVVPTYKMVQLSQVFPANTLQLAAPATYNPYSSLQCNSLATAMPLSNTLQLSSLVFTHSRMWPINVHSGLQLSGVNSISLWQPSVPMFLLLASLTYRLMRPMGPNTLLVAGLNVSLWHVSTSSCQMYVVTYALRLTTLQLLTTHLVLTMQPAGGYSTAGKGLPTCQVPSLTAPLKTKYNQVAAVRPVYTYSSYNYSYTQGYLQLPACASITFSTQHRSCEVQDSAAGVKSSPCLKAYPISLGQSLRCAALGLVNSVVNNVLAGLFECVIKGLDFWS